MQGISLRLGDPAIPVPQMHPAAGRTFSTGSGKEYPLSRWDLLGRNYLGDQLIDQLSLASRGKGDAASAGKPQKGASGHHGHQQLLKKNGPLLNHPCCSGTSTLPCSPFRSLASQQRTLN